MLDRVTTQRREAEKSLLEYARKLEHSNRLKEELESIINSSPVIVFLWKYEEGWPIEFVSENVTRLGYEVEDFTSRKILYGNIVYPGDLEKVERELARNIEFGCEDYSSEYRILTKSGEVRWVDRKGLYSER